MKIKKRIKRGRIRLCILKGFKKIVCKWFLFGRMKVNCVEKSIEIQGVFVNKVYDIYLLLTIISSSSKISRTDS